jgi:hypothetical protein
MGLINRIIGRKRKTAETPTKFSDVAEEIAPKPFESDIAEGDCRCVHCHHDFWFDDFIGICTALECKMVPGYHYNLQTGGYDDKHGPRQILLREETRSNFKEELELAPIEAMSDPAVHRCPVCRHRVYFYACPHCRHPMPRLKKNELNKTIAPAGIGASGKTVYMTALIERLLNRGIAKTNISIVSDFADHEDMRRYMENYNSLFRKKELFGSNDPAAVPPPYLLRTITEEKDALKREAYTLWYDFAGESFTNRAATDPIIQYFLAVGGILLFVDPTNCPEVVESLGIRANSEKGADPMLDSTVLNIIQTLLVNHGGQEALRQKLVAVIVNKVDVFKGKGFAHFGEDSRVWQKSPHRDAGAFCYDDFKEINMEVKEYVRCNHFNIYQQLIKFLNAKKDNVGYFAVSALGQTPDNNNKLDSEAGIKPFRVEDPYYWMLMKMGNMPSVGEEPFYDSSDSDYAHTGSDRTGPVGPVEKPEDSKGSATEVF